MEEDEYALPSFSSYLLPLPPSECHVPLGRPSLFIPVTAHVLLCSLSSSFSSLFPTFCCVFENTFLLSFLSSILSFLIFLVLNVSFPFCPLPLPPLPISLFPLFPLPSSSSFQVVHSPPFTNFSASLLTPNSLSHLTCNNFPFFFTIDFCIQLDQKNQNQIFSSLYHSSFPKRIEEQLPILWPIVHLVLRSIEKEGQLYDDSPPSVLLLNDIPSTCLPCHANPPALLIT